jgi:hypothetical protein
MVDQHTAQPGVARRRRSLVQRTADAGEQTPAVLGDCPVAQDDSAQRPSTITHRLPKPKTSMSTGFASIILRHLLQRQHARQHGALDAVALAVELDRRVAGGRGLHRQVQAQLRVLARQ